MELDDSITSNETEEQSPSPIAETNPLTQEM